MNESTLRLEAAPGTENSEGIRLLTLSRPEMRNAMNTAMLRELREVVHAQATDPGLRVLIFTGAGDKAFSSGGDLKERRGMSDETWRAQHQLIEEVFLSVKDFPMPTIAAVEGFAHAGGCELALMTDFIIASETADFCLAEVKRGIMPGGGGVQNFVRSMGMRRAKQLILTGDTFDAQQALTWGMVNEVVPAGQAVTAAIAIARRIGAAAPMSVRYAKLAASRGGEVDFHTGYMMDIAAYNVLVSSEDRREGIDAFNERRAPRWKNR